MIAASLVIGPLGDASITCQLIDGDLMMFERAQGYANVATVIERKTRYTILLRNNIRKSRPLMNKLIHTMSPVPAEARPSITFDRGFEFTSWRELHKGMGTKSWFCDPQALGQKGSVENMNKRVADTCRVKLLCCHSQIDI